MLELLKDVARLGYIEEWPGSGDELIFLLRGMDFLRIGAVWAGLAELRKISRWHLAANPHLPVPGEDQRLFPG